MSQIVVGGGKRGRIVEVGKFSVILRKPGLVAIYGKYDEILGSHSIGLRVRVVRDVTTYHPAMPILENDSAMILRNVGNRLSNDRNSVTPRKN